MAWFLCNVGSGGSELTVTCDSIFAGATITCTDGVTTLTKTCPSASPYIVKFNIPNSGIWTVSSGTSSTSVVITDSIYFHDIPVGATVIPTDDIETWLHCGNVWDKNYTTIAEVLLDASTLQALIASNNAADYMARSTSWAPSVCANSSAMSYIGANNYCANKLLTNVTWFNAICDSTYFESVLNVKVPTMTSNTTPSGVAKSVNSSASAYTVFDNNTSTSCQGIQASSQAGAANSWFCYDFGEMVDIKKFSVYSSIGSSVYRSGTNYKVQASIDDVTYDDLTDWISLPNSTASIGKTSEEVTEYRYIRMIFSQGNVYYSGKYYAEVAEIQFYGRAIS